MVLTAFSPTFFLSLLAILPLFSLPLSSPPPLLPSLYPPLPSPPRSPSPLFLPSPLEPDTASRTLSITDSDHVLIVGVGNSAEIVCKIVPEVHVDVSKLLPPHTHYLITSLPLSLLLFTPSPPSLSFCL